MMTSFISSCSDFCLELKKEHVSYQYNKNMDSILNTIAENNYYICSRCKQEKDKREYTVVATTYLIYDKINIPSSSNIGEDLHKLIIKNEIKKRSYIRPLMLYPTEYGIIIAARPDLMGIQGNNKGNNIIIREITTTYFENIKNDPDMTVYRLTKKRLQVLIYSFIAKKILENNVNYKVEVYFYCENMRSLCQGNRNEYLEEFLDKNRSLLVELLRDNIETDCYRFLYNGKLVEMPRLVIKGKLTPGKESYIEKNIEERTKKILKNF